jgi:hypothetical protein
MSDSEDEEDSFSGTQLLPTHHSGTTAQKGASKAARLTNVWDAREELFGISGDSDDEDATSPGVRAAGPPPPQTNAPIGLPKIFVTSET